MAKYSEKASEKVGTAVHEMKGGKLKTGTGKKVNQKAGNCNWLIRS